MTSEERDEIYNTVDSVGWDCILYNDFRHIKDEKFHELRKNHLKSIEEIKKYLRDVK